jgi:hypothetical protein
MRKSIVMVLVVLLAACTGPTDTSASSIPSVESTPKAPPIVIPAEALPVPQPSPWPIKPEENLDLPTSSDVAIGQERPFELYAHCGIDFRVDFDGSFWQSYAGSAIPAFVNLFRKGTMTLLSGEVAVFRFEESQGQDASIYFIRNDTPKPKVGCL